MGGGRMSYGSFFIYSASEASGIIEKFYNGSIPVELVVLAMKADYVWPRGEIEPAFTNPILDDWQRNGTLAERVIWKKLMDRSLLGFILSG